MPQGTANLWRGETISLPRCHLTFHFIFAVIAGDIWEGCPAVPGGGQGRGSQCCWGKARRGGPPPLHRTALPAIVGAGWEWGGRGGGLRGGSASLQMGKKGNVTRMGSQRWVRGEVGGGRCRGESLAERAASIGCSQHPPRTDPVPCTFPSPPPPLRAGPVSH